jgi:Ca-activated chloride channel family protein
MAFWLMVLPAGAAMWLAHYLYKHWSRRRIGVKSRFLALSRRSTQRRDVAVLVLASTAMGLVAAALVRPQVLLELRTPEFEQQDLILILDRSVSMRATDVRPSRAQRALNEIKTFLRRKPPAIDRVALVGFARASLVLSYLTRDVDSILFYLDWIADDPAVYYGTDMGTALTTALDVVNRDKEPSRKLFLMISDGDDQGGTLDDAVMVVRSARIRVHTIGIGSPQPALIPASLPGERESFLRDDAGRFLTTRFNESSLRSLAASTGGKYVRSVTGSELRSALETIAHANQVQTGWRTTTGYRDVYMLLLAAAGVAAAAMVALL